MQRIRGEVRWDEDAAFRGKVICVHQVSARARLGAPRTGAAEAGIIRPRTARDAPPHRALPMSHARRTARLYTVTAPRGPAAARPAAA